ncbi:MAG: hypothetical protein NZ703_04035 [Gemmataceae bacterium]|nr:hypothetical protein [Gemmataceae bacterium]
MHKVNIQVTGLILLMALEVAVGAAQLAAQQPPNGSAASTPMASNPTNPTAEARLDAHLTNWQKAMEGITNIFVTLTLKRSDPAATGIFKSDKEYKGELLCMKPRYARMRLVYTGDKTGQDYEAFICTGREIYD